MPMQTSGWGADSSPEDRPGVPMEHAPAPIGNASIAEQPEKRGLTRRVQLDRLTPVFGTAQPPKGIAGLMRRLAYRIPEHQARHWLMLIAADKVDVLAARFRKLLKIAVPALGIYALLKTREA